jgi:O-antigen ligase/polysaccharide polymerase Wzy-like membrane protein
LPGRAAPDPGSQVSSNDAAEVSGCRSGETEMVPELKIPRLQIPTSRPASVDPFSVLPTCVAFASGFFFQFNILTTTFGLPFLRITDALMFLFVPCLVVAVGINKAVRDGLFYFVVLFVVVAASLLFKRSADEGDKYMTLILLLTSVFTFFFVEANERILVWFSVGTLLGWIPSLAVLFLQAGGNTSLVDIGLGVPVDQTKLFAAALASAKPGGMWVHGNEAGHVYALAAACAFYLALRFRRPLIYIGFYAVFIASFLVTLNRGGLIAPTIALVYCYVRMGNFFLYVQSAVIVAVGLVIVVTVPNSPVMDTLSDTFEARFLEDRNSDNNITERMVSNLAGVQVALENPFGIGFKERTSIMGDRTIHGVVSVHNGFLSLAYQSGIFVSLFYILSCIFLFVNRRSVSPFHVIMFLFTATSMMFEELAFSQPFIFSVSLTIAAAWLHYVRGRNAAIKPLPVLQNNFSLRKLTR